MNKFIIRFKLKDGKTIETPKVPETSIDKLIEIIRNLSAEDKDFRFSDDEKELFVKAKDIISVEVVL